QMSAGGSHLRPALAASVVWFGAVGAGLAYGTSGESAATSTTLAAVPSEWVVDGGALSITVSQLGQEVTGEFADWTASINFSETPTDGVYGDVTVIIAIPSLTLGGVTEQALAPDFLNAASFATAQFSGPILQDGDAFLVDGTLDMVGQSQPLQLPFALELEGDVATASGTTQLDRRSFGMGESYDDESTVGFGVGITFDLTATRGGDEG
ncbi:MAG: YceI family protein, partial [Pseudomonadota bacterium]